MTMRPLIAPHARPVRRTPMTPSAAVAAGADYDPRRQAIGQNEHHADRKIDAGGDDDEGLRHRHQRQQHALVGRGLDDIGAEAGRMIARVDREHDDEKDECEQRRAILAEDDSASRSSPRSCQLHAPSGFVGNVERAADERALGDLGTDEHPLDRAVVEHQRAIAAADQLARSRWCRRRSPRRRRRAGAGAR